jgi:sulfur carrier protein
MTVIVNGSPRELRAACNVTNALAELGLEGQPLLVELNREALLKSDWDTRFVGDGDRIELIRIVAGG